MSFDQLGLSGKVLDAVTASGYTVPTPIQEQAIPHVLAKRDVMGIAQTGTGKTASFVLPMLSLLEKGRARARMPRTLILEPTRELAAQVEENFVRYGRNHKLSVALLIGGVSFDEQLRKLDRGVDVLIATPGRMLDLYERGRLLLTGVEILVIDEADRMLDMGFIPDIERIVGLVPFTRQTLFFSATMPPEIEKLSGQFLQNPVQVSVSAPASTSATITQYAVASGIDDWEKRDTLRRLVRAAEGLKNAIVFCNRKVDVSTVWKSLDRHGFSVGALHGDMDQRSRTAMLQAFKDGKMQLLVASDVAARGLDIPDVSHVFNFDVPVSAEDYVHRIGRTGRAGRSGTAYMIVTPGDRKGFNAIEQLIGQPVPFEGEAPVWDDKARRGRAPAADARGAGRERRRGDRSAPSRREPEASPARQPARQAVEDAPARQPAETVSRKAAAPAARKAAEPVARQAAELVASPPRRKSASPRPESRPAAEPARTPRGAVRKGEEVVISDERHPFGGDEHIPAFLRG